MLPLRTGESESLGFHRRRSMGERKQRRERERELLPLCLFSVRRGRGHRGVVFVCYENPADAARWGSETKLKGADSRCVQRNSTLFINYVFRKPGRLTQTHSSKPASCSREGKAGRETWICGVRMWRKWLLLHVKRVGNDSSLQSIQFSILSQ